MDNIYDTLAKLNKIANAPEIVKEDSNALMKKGLEDLMKKTKLNKQADYTPFSDKQSPDGLPEKKKDDKMFEAPSGQSKHEFIRALFKSHFGQPDYNESTGGRSGMRRLKIITGTTRGTGYEFANDGPGQDTSDFEREIGKAGLSGDVRVKSTGKAITVLYPDDFRMQSLAEAELVEKDDKMFEAPSGQSKHEFIRALFKSHFGQPDYNESTGGRSGMRRLKIITGTTRGTGYEFANDGPGQDTSDFEREIGKAGLSGDVRVKSTGKAITVLYPDDFRMQSLAEAELVEKESDEKHDKDKMHENTGTLKDAARQGVMARLAELAGLPVQEIEEALGTPQDVAAKIMAENPLDEDEVEEGNEFSGARDDAIKAGKDSFEVDGKTYPVKGDKKNEAIEEAEHDGMPTMKEMKACVDKGMTEAEICEKYSDCDQKKIKLMAAKCMNEESEDQIDEGAVKGMIQDVEEGMDKKEFEKKYPGQNYDEIKKEIEDRMDEEKVEETTSGSIAPTEVGGKPLFKNASVYESNEIVKRAKQLNEDMSISVNAGTNAEPSININASGEEAAKLAQLLKLAGMGMAQPGYGEVQVDVAEDQEFANGADDTNTMDTEYMTQDIAGGLNGPKKMAYPKVAGGDNPMSVLGESELNEVSEDRLMKLYQEYKAK